MNWCYKQKKRKRKEKKTKRKRKENRVNLAEEAGFAVLI